MNADIDSRILPQHLRCLEKPGAGNHDFDGTADPFRCNFNATHIGRMTRSHVIRPNQQPDFFILSTGAQMEQKTKQEASKKKDFSS